MDEASTAAGKFLLFKNLKKLKNPNSNKMGHRSRDEQERQEAVVHQQLTKIRRIPYVMSFNAENWFALTLEGRISTNYWCVSSIVKQFGRIK